MDNNVYVLRCTRDRRRRAARRRQRAREAARAVRRRLGVRKVLETHGHWDHIQAVPQLRDAGYYVGVTAEDADMLPTYDEVLEDDSVIEVGRLRLHTIHTPGHTPGSMCFRLEGPRSCSAATRCSPAGRATPSSRAATSPRSSARSRTACSRCRPRHDRAARPRRQHDDRPRDAPPPGVDRPGLVTCPTPCATTSAPTTRRRSTPRTCPPRRCATATSPPRPGSRRPDELLRAGRRPARPPGGRLQAPHRPWLLWRAGPAAAPTPATGWPGPTT